MTKKIVRKKAVRKTVRNDVSKIENNFGPGIGGGFNNFGFPLNADAAFTQTQSTVAPLFPTLRWYLVSNYRQFLSEFYVENGLVQSIVDVPVDDGLRGGILLKSKQLSDEQLEELMGSLDRDDDINTAGQAAKWNRLFGGAGILILTDQDPDEPLDMAAIDKDTPLEFRAVDMWELFWDKQNTEGYDPAIQQEDVEYYNYYGIQVHKTRVMKLKGLTAPSFIRPRLRGWGFSVVEALVRSINQYLRATDVGFEVLDEFKLDIYKIKNLVNTLLSPNGDAQIRKRIAMANQTKSYQNAIVMDSEDDYTQKQLSFAGLGEWMEQARMQVASDMRMPMLKLFGTPATGLNAGDEDSIEIYNSMVESQVRNKLKYDILRICEIKCQKLFGFVPSDLKLSFQPLRVMSAEQQENIKTQKFNRLIQAKQIGEISTQEFREACNKGDIFDVELDTTEMDLDGYMDDTVTEGANNPYDPKDIDDPGADRSDTKKVRATDKGGIPKDTVKPPDSTDEPEDIAKTKKTNSAQFERKAYEISGGDGQLDSRRLIFYDRPKDTGLWQRCMEVMTRAYPEARNMKFAIWLYEKNGGKFE